jgi:hypothetical protein
MAELAGHVNDRGRENDASFAEIIAESPAAIQELARAVRDLIYDVLPQTVEVVWPRQGSVGWGTGVKKFTEQFAYLMPFKGMSRSAFITAGSCPIRAGCCPRLVAGRSEARSLCAACGLHHLSRSAIRPCAH